MNANVNTAWAKIFDNNNVDVYASNNMGNALGIASGGDVKPFVDAIFGGTNHPPFNFTVEMYNGNTGCFTIANLAVRPMTPQELQQIGQSSAFTPQVNPFMPHKTSMSPAHALGNRTSIVLEAGSPAVGTEISVQNKKYAVGVPMNAGANGKFEYVRTK